MFLIVPETSNTFKQMFVDALEIQESSQIDPGSIWEKLFFDEKFQKIDPTGRLDVQANPSRIWALIPDFLYNHVVLTLLTGVCLEFSLFLIDFADFHF